MFRYIDYKYFRDNFGLLDIPKVKAYLSKNKWKDYEPAMDKLLKHKDESGNSTAKCYLTVAKEIENWDDSDNPYKVNIEVYKRKSKIIGVCDVRDEINEEISIYLKDESSDNVIEVVYAELCLFLDERIATEVVALDRQHRQSVNDRISYYWDITFILKSASLSNLWILCLRRRSPFRCSGKGLSFRSCH